MKTRRACDLDPRSMVFTEPDVKRLIKKILLEDVIMDRDEAEKLIQKYFKK